MAKIVAKDCMPFFIGESEGLEHVIGEDLKSKGFATLVDFVNSIAPVSIFGDDLKGEDADSKLAYSPFENKPLPIKTDAGYVNKKVWQAGRYVGATKIGGISIEILPRFGNEWLEYILDDVFHFKIVKSGSGESEKLKYNELMRRVLWHLWVRKFALADQYGLPRQFIKRSQVGMQIRGHLNAHKSLLPLFTKGQVVSEYREKNVDDAICSIVYKAYCILINRKFNKTQVPQQVQDSINTLYDCYQCHPVSVSVNDYNSISYKSIYLSWKPLVDFSWQIIQRDSLFKQKGSKGESFSIFLDMAEIWEAFLRKKLGEGFPDWRVLSVEECTRKIYSGQFYKRDIIPDIILEKDGQYMVFDAKYKRMRGIKANTKDSDVDRTDLFQIHTYIQYVERNMGHVVVGGLLYPITKDDEGKIFENTSIDTQSFHSDNLFGLEGLQNSQKTAFIIDGIFCYENQDYEMQKTDIEKEVNAMIDRINQHLP
ncbi:MAG: hypothetical protein IJQ83_07660 [Bacteroidales bacterium]|nr:hypothetical protein [Bacteroidales bacterium]